ncbi:hypothetical protein SAMN02745121_08543 [Nannocystis exedens]|uniref:Uncharacterized protein n=1 Tax=Nannocystis exedens TaxID=54 RepID=A0A1I2IB48_9BACT|nr:hypothetical protein [Nannocystis exedens]PCC70096.1 hypothetical protein NAEX_03129 [Nannocystis exedens]SFF38888.1 hypothetical protein SAMN02745121_08543 [Nannocystis exedens]
MDTHEMSETTEIRHQDASFEVREAETDDLEVVEFERAPLTDINFGF